MASSKISQLQLMQQNLQNVLVQKQQIQEQLTELDSALTELSTTDKAYRIVGKLMIATSKKELDVELQQKKEIAEIRLKNFAKQEDKLKGSLEIMQKEVLEELQKKE